MRIPRVILLTVLATLAALGGTASAADFQHVVARGESLTSVAVADGLSVSQLAAANGLSADSQLTAGTRLAIPPQGAVGASAAAGESSAVAAAPSVPAPAPASSAGAYVVQPGDTLSAIATRSGVSVGALAAANGLGVNGVLEAGRTLSVSGAPAAAAPVTTSAPAAPSGSSAGGAGAASQTVSASDIGTIAADSGVSPSLAEAIGYQESGFDNGAVSRSGATGVMQIEPGTWRYIHGVLGQPALAASSATDNVRGGVALLHSLLDQTGGDPAQAAAAYYQGLQSVREHGVYADTQRYVNDVMALRRRFGGG